MGQLTRPEGAAADLGSLPSLAFGVNELAAKEPEQQGIGVTTL
jgi:hypothetical protein